MDIFAVRKLVVGYGTVEVLKDLEEKKDSFEVRLKSLSRQEERIQSRFNQLQEQIKQALGKLQGQGAGAGPTAS